MRTETTRLFKDLLGLQGYLLEAPATEATPQTEPLPEEEASMNLFKSLWLLGGLQSIDSRVGEEDEPAFGPTYGNRLASERVFGPAPRETRNAERIDPADARVAHC